MSDSNLLQNHKLYKFGVFRLDTDKGLFVENEQVKLAPKVWQTLVFFVENQGRVITKNELFEKVWADTFVEDNALSFNISQLRKALAKHDNQTVFIETIPKRGFRFNTEVAEIKRENIQPEIIYEKRRIQEIIVEETISEPVAKKSFLLELRFFLPLFAVLMILLIGGIFLLRWKENFELHSIGAIQISKLASWKSIGSNIQSKYSISNNGNLLAYSSTIKENEEIFIKQISGGEDVQVTKGNWNNSSPIWSPDDKQIAYVSVRENQVGIYVSPSLGGNAVLQKITGTDKVSLVKWSNDKTKIYYEVKGNLFVLNIENKEVARITDFSETKEDRNFSFSKDEDYIAYVEKNNEQKDIWIKELPDGEPFRITDDVGEENEIVWHPDSKRIFYGLNRNRRNQINVAFVDKAQPLEVTKTDDEYKLLDISADGMKVFYVSWQEKSDVWSIETENGKETKISREDDAEFWADVSADEKFLSYQINSMPNAISRIGYSYIVVSDKSGNKRETKIKGINQKWLPDNRRIAFFRWEFDNKRYNIWTYDTISGEEKQITTDGAGFGGLSLMPYNRNQVKEFDWSNDSRKLLYADSKRQNILLISPDSNETVNLTKNDNPNLSYYCPVWSRDGKKIIFVSELKPSASGENTIYGVILFEANNMKTIFSGTEPLRLLGWSESDDEFYCLSTADVLKSRPIDAKLLRISINGHSRAGETFQQISVLSSAVSPDGKKIAFTKREENKDNIFITGTGNNLVKKITENADTETLFGSLIWSPDGKTVFFDKQEKINIISVIDNFK